MGYYVYELVLLPDALVCYVGKGSGARLYDHQKILANSRHSKYNRPLYRAMRELLSPGKVLKPRIVYETEDEVDALLHEKSLIAHYGFDRLLNAASHAFLGKRLKSAAKIEISESIKELWRCGRYARRRARRRDLPRKQMLRGWFPKTRRDAKHRGVYKWHNKQRPGLTPRWVAKITEGGKTRVLCNTTNFQMALRAYDDAAERLHGVRPNGT